MEKTSIDILWVLISASLVFLMQGGFLCLESGLTRSKNNINVALKNLVDFGISITLFWAVGFSLMFGVSEAGWISASNFFPDFAKISAWQSVFFLFQAMFCGTAVTILSGAVAERMRFKGYIIISILVSGLIYPVFGHWSWNSLNNADTAGWLESMGFLDFAGSTVVHSVGGWVSLAALLVVGPRTGRFPENGPPQNIPGSNLPMAALGVGLLWLGWIGFNGGSTLAMDDQVPRIVANTMLAGGMGMIGALAMGWYLTKIVHVDYVMNGALAGLVAITANCYAVSAIDSVVIGFIGGMVMVGASSLLVKFRIDDVIGAIWLRVPGERWQLHFLETLKSWERVSAFGRN
jgi:Amt family ammonium transporter